MKIIPRSANRRSLVGFSILAILGLATWQTWSWWRWASSPIVPVSSTEAPASESVSTQQIHIPYGTSVQGIGQKLEAAGLIHSDVAWTLWARWLTFRSTVLQGQPGSFQAGVYELSPTQPLSAIAHKIWIGEVTQDRFTIPEGWTRQQMADYFEAEGYFTAEAFLAATQQIPRDEFPWLPPGLPHLEGFLFPSTYQLPATTMTPTAVVRQMLQGFEQLALPVFQRAQTTAELDFHQWVTLASIVEKEAVIPGERPLIAGVFVQRLRRGMLLGADPTVEYGLGIVQTPDQPLTYSQVNIPSPYNTYLNPGLPPTPIASPGLASLEATLYPEETDYLYFVARYDGTHVFSRTLRAHRAAQAAIRRERQSQF